MGKRIGASKGDRVGANSEVEGKTKQSEEKGKLGKKKVKKMYRGEGIDKQD